MKTAIITGAANGIGLALTQIALQKGHTVVMVDKDESKLKKEAESLHSEFPGRALERACDITQVSEVNHLAQEVFHKLGHIHWIFNNAGIIGPLGPIWDLSPESTKKVIDVNLYGMMNIIQSFMPLLFQQTFRSHIINIASLYALCTGSQTAPYSMSKHAVLALSESLYFDLNRLNKPVDVSIAFPSFTDTALLSHNAESNSPLHDSLKFFLAHSRPALDTAKHILNAVEQKQFYIFPDKEVKEYSEARNKAIVMQENPHVTSIEKLMNTLIKRQQG